MTAVAYTLGVPRPAASRGGDCRGYDLDQGRYVYGPHRFASTGDCQISNGLLRVTVIGAGGASYGGYSVGYAGLAGPPAVPALTVEAWRGETTVGDVYVDTYADLYGGTTSPAAWLAMGTLTIDSPSVSALLTGVQVAHINAEAVTIRLVAPLMADAFVTLRRGERMARIHHGSTRAPFVDIDRRIRWTASPSPVGITAAGRVEESPPAIDGFLRFVASIDTVTANAGAFSVTASSVTSARFGAGVGTWAARDDPEGYHSQLGDASRPRLVVA